MQIEQVICSAELRKNICDTVAENRISHAQLLVACEGSGGLPLALAYASEVLLSQATDKHATRLKTEKFTHPDIHFVFPVNINKEIKKDPLCDDFLPFWRDFLLKKPYGSLTDWYRFIEIENKQGLIGTDEAVNISRKLALKSFEGGYKVMIIWHAEKMNAQCANKLLKLLEEPPVDTLFLLVTDNENDMLPTIASRCQKIFVKRPTDHQIEDYLCREKGTSPELAKKITYMAGGDISRAIRLLENNSNERFFESMFVRWVRASFMANKNAGVLRDLIAWSDEISGLNREEQKQFLLYAGEIFRQALLKQYSADSLVFADPKSNGFSFDKFSNFIHGRNILPIYQELEKAIFHIERNGNARMIFLDMSVKITRFLHMKSLNPA